MLNQGETGGRVQVVGRFFFSSVRRMIGSDNADSAVAKRLPQRVPIGAGLDRGVAFYAVSQTLVIPVVKPQVMHADFRRDAAGAAEIFRAIEQFQFLRRGQMQHMKFRAVLSGQRYGQAGRAVAALRIADFRMRCGRDCSFVGFFRACQVFFDTRSVLTVGRD